MEKEKTYRIFPLGDSALTIELANYIDEEVNDRVLALNQLLQHEKIPGVIETVPSYSSISIYFDLSFVSQIKKNTTCFEWMKKSVDAETSTSVLIVAKALKCGSVLSRSSNLTLSSYAILLVYRYTLALPAQIADRYN